MTEYLEHISQAGERWDQLAWHYYGDAMLMQPIIEANPQLRLLPRLSGGLSIRIPIIDPTGPANNAQDLPPWKR